MIVTIAGTGNAGCAHGYKIAERGHTVRLLEPFDVYRENFEAIRSNGGIWAESAGGERSFQKIELITKDASEALEGADAVLILTQSLQHGAVSELIKPLLKGKKLVITTPGYMGSLFLKGGGDRHVIFAEGESMPFDARLTGKGVVRILFRNVRNALSFHPKAREDEGLELANSILDTYGYKRESIIESALHNPNLIVHTIGAIMSAARIEYSGGDFWMYREAFTPSIWNLVNVLDKEKMELLFKAGCEKIPYLEACRFRTGKDLNMDPMDVFRSYALEGSPRGPEVVNHRYIYEDVPVGLCLMSSLGKKFEVQTPICDSLINIASALLGRDFRAEGRTLEMLGLADMSAGRLLEYVKE